MSLTTVGVTCRQPELWSSVRYRCCPSRLSTETARGVDGCEHSEGMSGECMGCLEEAVSEEEGESVQNKVYGGQQET